MWEMIAALAGDFPKLWQDSKTPDRERKRMVRLLLEDVTIIKRDKITVHVRFKGGISRTLTLPRPLNSWEANLTPTEVIAENRSPNGSHTDKEITRILNERGFVSGGARQIPLDARTQRVRKRNVGSRI